MLDQRARDLLKISEGLFSKKNSLDSLRQEIASLYYFERADFTCNSALGTDYASGAMTSYPHLARRELGGLLPALLRSGVWFSLHLTDRKLDEQDDIRAWMEFAGEVQMKAMRDPDSGFTIATDEADDDLITFGDCVTSVEVDIANTSLLYRNWHIRDCAWMENERKRVDWISRKWLAPGRLLKRKFRNVHPDVIKKCKDDPDHEVDVRHIVCRADDYDYEEYAGKRRKTYSNTEFVSLYIDVTNQHVMELTPVAWFPYVVSRWGTLSNSQYGYSPAVVLPDARSANVIRAVLLDAGEKAVNPPLIAVQDAIRSDIALHPGGITFADIEYDERLGEVLRPISQEMRGLPFGADLEVMFKDALAGSFYLNKLVLPPDMGGEKTAYEIQKRVQEHIRSSSAMFEPIDAAYSSPLCETTFQALMSVGTFGRRDPRTGAIENAPPEMASKSLEFEFTNPIRETEKEMKAQRFTQGLQISDAVRTFDPAQMAQINITRGFRDALKGIGWPTEWLASEQAVEQAKMEIEQQKKMQMGMQAAQGAAEVAATGGQAAKALSEAGVQLG